MILNISYCMIDILKLIIDLPKTNLSKESYLPWYLYLVVVSLLSKLFENMIDKLWEGDTIIWD